MLFYEVSVQVSCLFQKTYVVNYLLLSYKSFMCILDTGTFSHVCFVNIFSQSVVGLSRAEVLIF